MRTSITKELMPVALLANVSPIDRIKKSLIQSIPGLFIIGFLLQAGPIAAQQETNLLTNPGFEAGNTSGWSPFGSPTLTAETAVVHSGTYACAVTGRTATYMGASQSLLGLTQPNETNTVSAWVMLDGGTNQTMQLTMQQIVSGTTTFALIATGNVTSTNWTQLSGIYTNLSSTPSTLTFYVEVPTSATNSYYLDDVQFDGQIITIVTNPPISGTSTVDWNNVHQRIDGFGASSAWNPTWTTAEEQLLFSTNNSVSYQSATYHGVGLSLLRSHIAPASSTAANALPSTVETSVMQAAQSFGARVWCTPWTPNTGFKSVNDIYDSDTAAFGGTNGGSYLGSLGNITNVNYASQLANFVANMKTTYGVNLYAISLQNEPDADVTTYEACQWSGTQIHDFVTNLFSALAAQGVGSTKIIIPESESWSSDTALYTPSLNDPAVAPDVSIVADHDYVGNNNVGDQTAPAALNVSGKALWETEVALLSGSDSSINNGVYYAQRIYQYMTQANANAYHYWWLVSGAAGNEGLLDSSAAVTKRLFTFGQYSRFVRPNYNRINATSSQVSCLVSAYKNSASPNFAIVVVNTNVATAVVQTFNLANFTTTTVTPWITSATTNLAPLAPVAVSNGTFTYPIPQMSVVTFVGAASTVAPPVFAAVPNQTVNAGVTLLVTNTATASDVPPNMLSFGPANAFPTGATVNSSSGIFSWRPMVSQANSTNAIAVQVTDSGSNLSATNNFNVVVNAVTNPVISGVTLSPGQFNITVSGPQGPDYTLLTSSNLFNWQILYTTSSPVIPFTVSDTNVNQPAQFYQLQIGP
jgi:glucuronoarabinoxylan endo-1,4-beta-xylanase